MTADRLLSLAALIDADRRRVLVVDDDPTGAQAAADVDVVLGTDLPATRKWFDEGARSLYVVANTRAMSEADATATLRRYRDGVQSYAMNRGDGVAVVLRGDSTLRGHVLAEADVFGARDSVLLFVPAFPEGGRVTIDGTHFILDSDNRPIPVNSTEFASDPVFGYLDAHLPRWFAHRDPDRPVLLLGLAQLRAAGPAAVSAMLLDAPPGSVVVPDAETVDDIADITSGLLMAEAGGAHIVVRSAATLAALRAGVYATSFLGTSHGQRDRTLVVCGSHTAASTRQLERLCAVTGTDAVELDTEAVLSPAARSEVIRCAEQLATQLRPGAVAVLCTQRRRKSAHSTLDHGARLMRALTRVVEQVRRDVDSCVVKGGISSADVASAGFHARRGRVVGRVRPGISLWSLDVGRPKPLPYVVVPGNVGSDETLVDTLGWLRGD